MPFCTTCGRQEEFCRCPMRTQDLVLMVAICCLAFAIGIAMLFQALPVETPQEHGHRTHWRQMSPPRWLQIPKSRPARRVLV